MPALFDPWQTFCWLSFLWPNVSMKTWRKCQTSSQTPNLHFQNREGWENNWKKQSTQKHRQSSLPAISKPVWCWIKFKVHLNSGDTASACWWKSDIQRRWKPTIRYWYSTPRTPESIGYDNPANDRQSIDATAILSGHFIPWFQNHLQLNFQPAMNNSNNLQQSEQSHLIANYCSSGCEGLLKRYSWLPEKRSQNIVWANLIILLSFLHNSRAAWTVRPPSGKNPGDIKA